MSDTSYVHNVYSCVFNSAMYVPISHVTRRAVPSGVSVNMKPPIG